MAAWQVIPPPSVTSAAARRMVGTQSGLVIGATRISPRCSVAPWSGAVRIRTAPETRPGEAARPLSSTAAPELSGAAGAPAATARADPAACGPIIVVIGRDCTIASRPPAYAHSTS